MTAAPVPATTAEGVWQGTASTGARVGLVVLENGETYGLYTSGNNLAGALYGITASSGTTLSGSGSDFNIPSRTVANLTYSGTFSEKSSLQLTSPTGGTFAATYDASYDQPASLAALAGTFSGGGISGRSSFQSAPVTVSTTGTIAVPSSNGCSQSGNISPRASGKNIFDVVVTFTGGNCALGNGTVTKGIAHFDATARELVVLAFNPAKTDGFIYVGKK